MTPDGYPTHPHLQQQRQTRRAELVIAVVLCQVLIFPVLAFGMALGKVLDGLLPADLTAGEPTRAHQWLGLALFAGAPAAGILGFWLVGRARAARSRTLVAAGGVNGTGRPDLRGTWLLTALAWGLLVLGFATAVGFGAAGPPDPTLPPTDPDQAKFEQQIGSGWGLLVSLLVFLLLVTFFAWRHTERVQVQPLVDSGRVVRTAQVERSQRERVEARWRALGVPEALIPFILGLVTFTGALAVGVVTGVFAFLQDLVDGRSLTEAAGTQGFALLLAGMVPGAVALAAVVLFFPLRPTRWVVREAVRHPVSLTAIGLIGAGGVAMLVSPDSWFVLLAALGFFVASVTGLMLQDLGPQPWLGLFTLTMALALSFSNATENESAARLVLPHGVFGWVGAAIATAVALNEIREHWRSSYGLEQPDGGWRHRSVLGVAWSRLRGRRPAPTPGSAGLAPPPGGTVG